MTDEAETGVGAETKAEFSRQARIYDRHILQGGIARLTDWMLDFLDLQPRDNVLDVAAGTGLVARAIAPSVKAVTAFDSTQAMLEAGRREAQAQGLTNITFRVGDAAHLPYRDNEFDLVTCRLAVHHFPNPGRQVEEMARVCRPGGQVGIADIIGSNVQQELLLHNQLERMRDPSHTAAQTLDALELLATSSGLVPAQLGLTTIEQDMDRWLNLSQTADYVRLAIRAAFESEIAGGPATGLQPIRRNGALVFHHRLAILVAERPESSAS